MKITRPFQTSAVAATAALCLVCAAPIGAQTAGQRTPLFDNSGLRAALNVAQASGPGVMGPQTPAAPSVLDEAGPHYRVWKRAAPPGAATTTTGGWHSQPAGRTVEIQTGMNYWDGSGYVSSDSTFDPAPDGDGFVASRTQHKVHAPAELPGVITLTTPDGIALRTVPEAIALYDSASGRFAIIASITNCSAVMIATNKILYENAFDNLPADILITLEKGSYESDVVLRSRLNPARYGFPTNTTRIQIITEFLGAPAPQRLARPIYTEQTDSVRQRMASPDLIDELLGFGEVTFGAGRAIAVGQGADSGRDDIAVAKEYVTAAGRNFLIESITFSSARAALSSLPTGGGTGACISGKRETLLAKSFAPSPASSIKSRDAALRGSKQLARARVTSRGGLAALKRSEGGLQIDYQVLVGSLNGTNVFAGDTTYFVSGPVYCSGPITIEGGAVFKFPQATAYLQINNSLTLLSSAYRPSLFTAVDDDSVGESMAPVPGSGRTGHIVSTGYANPALDVTSGTPQLKNLRFSYCKEAIKFRMTQGSQASVWRCQLVQCISGIHIAGVGCGCGGGGCGCAQVSVANVLFGRVTYPIYRDCPTTTYGWLSYCTLDSAQTLASGGGSWTFNNSIFSTITTWSSGGANIYGDYNGFFATPSVWGAHQFAEAASPFAPTSFDDAQGHHTYYANGQGAYYLRDASSFRDVGAVSADPNLRADLASRTTIAPTQVRWNDYTSSLRLGLMPIRDSDAPHLGYHYPSVDHIIHGITVNSATLNIDPGTVLAYMRIPGGYDWGIRLNPGSRLNVNGHPTNRVVLARLEGVQKSPLSAFRSFGALVTVKGLDLYYGPAGPPAGIGDVDNASFENRVSDRNCPLLRATGPKEEGTPLKPAAI